MKNYQNPKADAKAIIKIARCIEAEQPVAASDLADAVFVLWHRTAPPEKYAKDRSFETDRALLKAYWRAESAGLVIGLDAGRDYFLDAADQYFYTPREAREMADHFGAVRRTVVRCFDGLVLLTEPQCRVLTGTDDEHLSRRFWHDLTEQFCVAEASEIMRKSFLQRKAARLQELEGAA